MGKLKVKENPILSAERMGTDDRFTHFDKVLERRAVIVLGTPQTVFFLAHSAEPE
jgi:hypothetical protein